MDTSVIRRLAFIKYLYGLGVRQSQNPEPFSAAALLTFHDSIELLLQLASEFLDAGTTHSTFMDYWPSLGPKLPGGQELSQKESMRRLNKARVAFKHHGTMPSKLDVESFRASTTAFFEDNVPLVFGRSFESVSLIEFVQPEAARDHLQKSEQLLAEAKLKDCLCEIVQAFEVMLDDYERRKYQAYGKSPFFMGHSMSFLNSFFMGIDRGAGSRLSEYIDKVSESIEALREAVRILALGLDYRKYTRFRLYVPSAMRTEGGTFRLHWRPRHLEATPDDVRFCLTFVIETAVTLRDFDYDVNVPPPEPVEVFV